MCPAKEGPRPRAAEPASAADNLEDYRRKRDPLRTNEPFSTERGFSSGGTRAGRFVVHLHAARRRHYDLRLQVGRTLKSFAVPRGPSLDPREKRLAVHTEDHPLEYADFEDVIPAGNYGAGAMIAWDIGRVVYLENSAERGIEDGKLDFVLSGYKLQGRYALVHTRRGEGNEWLLIKKQDAHSREEGDILEEAQYSVLSGLNVDELPQKQAIAEEIAAEARRLGARPHELTSFEPMLCADEGARLDDPERVYELKLDGVRIVAHKRGRKVSLAYRNGRNCTHSYPEVARAVETLAAEELVLDGEIVAFDEQGRPRFQRLGPRIQARSALDVQRVASETPVSYLAFDLLGLQGLDLSELPLLERKRLLFQLLRGRGVVRPLDHIEARGAELFELCRQRGLEGVVAKKKSSRYYFGPRRGEEWVKVKCERDEEFVVVGVLPGKGSRAELGALIVASFEPSGELLFRGRVGSGFDEKLLSDLTASFRGRYLKEPSVAPPLPEEAQKIRWLAPELVVAVRHMGFTDDGRLRAPVFCGLRPDVALESCTARPHDASGAAEISVEERPPSPAPPPATRHADLVLSNRDKIFWPEEGYTKGDLLDYYAAVAPVLLPFLRDRPVVLVRHPDGIYPGKSFYQWNVPRGTPDWIRTLTLQSPDEPEHEKKTVFLVDDVDTLLYIINLGAIPIHVLACRAAAREHADFLTFDLDLNEQPFTVAVELALSLREILTDAGLVGFPKTSGQGGLHVLVPLGPGVPFAAAKLLVELLGRLLVAQHPSVSTMERRIEKRGGRLYVDTGQTGSSRTIVAPYSVRAQAGAGVSTPLFWDELSGALDPARFNLMTVPARISEIGDPFAEILRVAPDIAAALTRLERLVREG